MPDKVKPEVEELRPRRRVRRLLHASSDNPEGIVVRAVIDDHLNVTVTVSNARRERIAGAQLITRVRSVDVAELAPTIRRRIARRLLPELTGEPDSVVRAIVSAILPE